MPGRINASLPKARCPGLLDEVALDGEVLANTENGRPVSELHPCHLHPR